MMPPLRVIVFPKELSTLGDSVAFQFDIVCRSKKIPLMDRATDYIAAIVGTIGQILYILPYVDDKHRRFNEKDRGLLEDVLTSMRTLRANIKAKLDYTINIVDGNSTPQAMVYRAPTIPELMNCLEDFHASMISHATSMTPQSRFDFLFCVSSFLLCSAMTPGGCKSKRFSKRLPDFVSKNRQLFQPLRYINLFQSYQDASSTNETVSDVGGLMLGVLNIDNDKAMARTNKAVNVGLKEDSYKEFQRNASWHPIWKHHGGHDIYAVFTNLYQKAYADFSIIDFQGSIINTFVDYLGHSKMFTTYENLSTMVELVSKENHYRKENNADFASRPDLERLRDRAQEAIYRVDTKTLAAPQLIFSEAEPLKLKAEEFGIYKKEEMILFTQLYCFQALLDEKDESIDRFAVFTEEAELWKEISVRFNVLSQRVKNHEKDSLSGLESHPSKATNVKKLATKPMIHHAHTSLPQTSPSQPTLSLPQQTHAPSLPQQAPAAVKKKKKKLRNIPQIVIQKFELDKYIELNEDLDVNLVETALRVSEFAKDLEYSEHVRWVNLGGFKVPTRLHEHVSDLQEIIDYLPPSTTSKSGKFAQQLFDEWNFENKNNSAFVAKFDPVYTPAVAYVLRHKEKHFPEHTYPNMTAEQILLDPFYILLHGTRSGVDHRPESRITKIWGKFISTKKPYYIMLKNDEESLLKWIPVSYGPDERGGSEKNVVINLRKYLITS